MKVDMEENFLLDDLEEALDHGIIVSRLARMLAEELGESDEFCYEVAQAGMLHDVGKLQLSQYLDHYRENTLKIEKMNYVRQHPMLSREILKKYDYSDMILDTVYHHHENYDGSGYPDNLKGQEIPYGARILRVCDVFVALASERTYRTAFSVDSAVELLYEEARNFDMRVLLAMQRLIQRRDFEELKLMIADANREMRISKERLENKEEKPLLLQGQSYFPSENREV